jgi:dsRNA-specific ribonuclease/16S rRNA G966 N2-methylase RsmD
MAVQFAKDRTITWKSYFPVRNGIKPETFLVEGRNYTNETLYYMSKARIARTITDKIESFLNESPYVLIEVCAGIGGNTLEFLSRKNCVSVMSFERDPMRRLMLQRNIMGYNYGDKAMVVHGDNFKDRLEITGDEDFNDYNNAVFFMDPPWLPESFKGGDYKKNYILKDMKVGKLTLEQWLEKLTNTAYIVVYRLPPNYILNQVKGWTYVVDELGNDGRLITCIPNRNLKNGVENDFGEIIYTQKVSATGEVVTTSLTSLYMKLKSIDTSLSKQYQSFRNSCNALTYEKAIKENKCKIFTKWGFIDPNPNPELSDKFLGRITTSDINLKKEEYTIPAYSSPDGVNLLPIKDVKIAEGDVIIGKNAVKPDNSEITLAPRLKLVEKSAREVKEQVVYLRDAPKPSTKALDLESPEWTAEFQNYIHFLLSKFINSKELVNNLVTLDYMRVWIQAFTSASYNPSIDKNYESLEFTGDSILKYVYSSYLVEGFGNDATANLLTQYKNLYMTKRWQPYMAEALGFRNWIRSVTPVDEKALEDVSEAFVAALNNVADMYKSYGYGMRLCKKFVYFITQNIEYSNADLAGDEKRRIEQRIETYIGGQDKGRIVEEVIGSGPTLAVKLSLRKDIAEKFIEAGFKMNPDNIIGMGKNPLLSKARNLAWSQADKFFDAIGFTEEFANSTKKDKVWDKLKAVNETLVMQVLSKIRREGYTKEYMETDTKGTGKLKYVFLNALDSDKNIVRLGKGKNEDLIKAQLEALQDFLEN